MDSRRYNNENKPPCGVESNPQQNRRPLASTYQPVYTNSSLPNINQQPPNHRIPMGSVLPQLRHPLTQLNQEPKSYVTNCDSISGCYSTSSICSTFAAGNPITTCQVIPPQAQGDTPRSSLSPDDTSSNGSPSLTWGSGVCPGKKGVKQAEKQRLSNKQQVEKQRRERINSSMNELKSLLLQDNSATGLASAKLERADVLEMAVNRIKELKSVKTEGDAEPSGTKTGQNPTSEGDLKNMVTRYAAGFAQCTQEVMTFIEMCDELKLDPAWKTKLANHLQSCNRTLELATQNNKEAAPAAGSCPSNLAVPNVNAVSHDVTRSPVLSYNMYNQASPMIPSRVLATPQSRTPNINYISPATPISSKYTVNSTSTSRDGISRLNSNRQARFIKTEQVTGNGSPGFASCNSSFRDNMPKILGTVATPPTPKQAPFTTSMAHFNRGIRQPNFPMFTPSPPRKVLRISGNSPIVPPEDSNDEIVFEPMYPLPEKMYDCWRPW